MSSTVCWADDDEDETDPEVEKAAPASPHKPAPRDRGDSVADSVGSAGHRGGSVRSHDSGGRRGGDARADRSQGPILPDQPPFRAFVGNLNHGAVENDIGSFFYDLGCNVVDVHLSRQDDGSSKGFCHMEFGNRDSLRIAIEQNGRQFMGRALRMDVAEARQGRSGGRYGGGGGGGGGHHGGRYDDHRQGGGRGNDRHREQDAGFSSFGNRQRNGGSHMDDRRGPAPHAERSGEQQQRNMGPSPSSGLGSGVSAPTRPKLMLQPRTKPIEPAAVALTGDGAAAVARPASIFGAGKPQDESKYEERKKKEVVIQQPPPPPPAVSSVSPSKSKTIKKDSSSFDDTKTITTATDSTDPVTDGTSTTSIESKQPNTSVNNATTDGHVKQRANDTPRQQQQQQQQHGRGDHGSSGRGNRGGRSHGNDTTHSNSQHPNAAGGSTDKHHHHDKPHHGGGRTSGGRGHHNDTGRGRGRDSGRGGSGHDTNKQHSNRSAHSSQHQQQQHGDNTSGDVRSKHHPKHKDNSANSKQQNSTAGKDVSNDSNNSSAVTSASTSAATATASPKSSAAALAKLPKVVPRKPSAEAQAALVNPFTALGVDDDDSDS